MTYPGHCFYTGINLLIPIDGNSTWNHHAKFVIQITANCSAGRPTAEVGIGESVNKGLWEGIHFQRHNRLISRPKYAEYLVSKFVVRKYNDHIRFGYSFNHMSLNSRLGVSPHSKNYSHPRHIVLYPIQTVDQPWAKTISSPSLPIKGST